MHALVLRLAVCYHAWLIFIPLLQYEHSSRQRAWGRKGQSLRGFQSISDCDSWSYGEALHITVDQVGAKEQD